RRDDGREERAREQLALDRDVDDADALAQHARERAEHERHREEQRALQEARERDRGLARAGPGEEREDDEDAEHDGQPDPDLAPVARRPEGQAREQQREDRQEEGRARRADRDRLDLEEVLRGRQTERRLLPARGQEREEHEREQPDDRVGDGGAPADRRERLLGARGGRGRGSRGGRGAHAPASCVVGVVEDVARARRRAAWRSARVGPPGVGSRKIARTSGGAAMNSTMSDWTTSTMSIGVPVRACIAKPPARSAPNSRPARTVPSGRERPSRATVIASKPKLAATPAVSTFSVPSTCAAPPRPASAPAIAMTQTVTHATEMPAVRAACGFSPTARKRKPSVERSMSHHTPTAASSASRKPRWRRKPRPSTSGNVAEPGIGGLIGLLLPARWNAGVVSRYAT